MSKPRSYWRARARPVIARVLAAAPPEVTEKEARRLLSAAYPFGEKDHHPYRMWCAEVRAALELRFGARRKKQAPGAAPPRYALLERNGPWLDVRCGWCEDRPAGGCLVCVRLHQRVREVVSLPDWKRLRSAAAGGDGLARAALQDFLEETLGWRP